MDYSKRTKIRSIVIDDKVPVNSDVIILGLVRTVRSSKNVGFVEVNDGSCMNNLQGVIGDPAAFPVLDKILTGASVRMKGKLIPSQGKGQKYEVEVKELDLIGQADESYPLQKKPRIPGYFSDYALLTALNGV